MNMSASQVGHPVSTAHAYEPYHVDGVSGPPTFGSRMPPPPPPFQHSPPSGPHSMHEYGQQSTSGRLHPHPLSSHNHNQSPYPVEQETGHSGHLGHHQYFGSTQGGGFSSQGHMGIRRSISPVNVTINGPSSGKQWVAGHGGGRGNEWMGEGRKVDVGMDVDDEGRDRRDSRRERERERERERDKLREKSDRELHDFEHERERERNHHLHQQQMHQPPQHRHPPPGPSHQHVHAPQGQISHHHTAPHRHHHHHHHVVHHHHNPSSNGAGGNHMPPSAPPIGSAALSPRIHSGSRDFDAGRPRPPDPTEVINLPSKSAHPSHWKGDDPHIPLDYRDIRGGNKHLSRPSSGPPGIGDERERPLAMPFVMTSTHNHASSAPPNGQGSPAPSSHSRTPWGSSLVEDNSHRIPQSSSSTYLGPNEGHHGETSSAIHRHSGSVSSLLSRPQPPSSGPLSRQNSLGLSPPRLRVPPSSSPPSTAAFPGDMRSPARYSQPPPPSGGLPPIHPSVTSSPGMKGHRPSSPTLSGKLGLGVGTPSSLYSPRLSGPGRTSTPMSLSHVPTSENHNTNGNSVTTGAGLNTSSGATSLHLPFPPIRPGGPSSSDKPSPLLPPKVNVAQMVDGP
jgi:hypothetical protein